MSSRSIFVGPAWGEAPIMGANPFLLIRIWLVEMENAFSSRRVILYSTMPGQIVAKSECESFGRKVVNKLGFSKMSRDTTDQMVVMAQK